MWPRPLPTGNVDMRSGFTLFLLAVLLSAAPACGIKAPPRPRETVVPSPVQELSIRQADDGIVLEFTLPATRLDGGPLEDIAGYRIVRQGPDGKKTEEEVWFSFSQQKAMAGKKVSFPDARPAGPGLYRYTVLPLDAYGSHPRGNATVEFSQEDADAAPPASTVQDEAPQLPAGQGSP